MSCLKLRCLFLPMTLLLLPVPTIFITQKLMKMKLTLIICLMIVVASCSKDNDDDTNTPDKTIEQLLTEKAWKADELRIQLSNNTNTYYKRGGTSNTANYDSDSLRFNTYNTGTYYFSGAQYATTWNFIDANKFKMTIV